jgi:hypothetical protein
MTLNDRLAALQDEYTYRLNILLEEDRVDLACKLADKYVDEAAQLVSSSESR